MHFLTAKITNVQALERCCGAHEAAYVVRRALTRIAREIRQASGQVVKSTATRVIGEFVAPNIAETLACRIDAAINGIPVAKGIRIATDVFVADREKAEIWRPTCMDYIDMAPVIRSGLGPAVSAVVRFENREAVLDARRSVVTIGRLPGNTIVVPHQWVSRHHAKIVWKNGVVEVVDTSVNGTFVRFHGVGIDNPVGKSTMVVDASASLSFGLPFAVANGKPIRAEIELRF